MLLDHLTQGAAFNDDATGFKQVLDIDVGQLKSAASLAGNLQASEEVRTAVARNESGAATAGLVPFQLGHQLADVLVHVAVLELAAQNASIGQLKEVIRQRQLEAVFRDYQLSATVAI